MLNDRMTEKVLLLVEGVNENNWDLANEVLTVLDDVDISQVTILGKPIHSPTPWGFTARS